MSGVGGVKIKGRPFAGAKPPPAPATPQPAPAPAAKPATVAQKTVVASVGRKMPLEAFKLMVESLGGDTRWIDNIPRKIREIDSEVRRIDEEIARLERKKQELLERREAILRFAETIGLDLGG